jgi:hypothetical protein
MKSLMLLWQTTAEEYGGLCGISTLRDFKTVTKRVENEGLSFLTIALPSISVDLQKGLANGKVTRDTFFLPFGKRRGEGLPQFLGGFLELVFDPSTGIVRDEPSVDAIQAVLHLSKMFGKLELPASEERRKASIEGFISCEEEIRRFDASRTAEELSSFGRVASLLWREVLARVDFDLDREFTGPRDVTTSWPYLVPKHGPGATADKLVGNNKFEMFSEWPQRLESVFPFGEYALPSWRYRDRYHRVDLLEPGSERPVRVISVPKTARAPRIIAKEPSYMQYMQQGLAAMLVPSIQADWLMGRMVGFDDQWRNNLLAQKGSLDGSLATLDLSEASDRVSNQLVREMLRPWPHIFEAVDATRSRKADVPGHGVIRLAKFASMGSALTFPVEAMVFSTIVFLGIERASDSRLSRRSISRLRDRVRIYGDDIIVPTEYAESVISTLESFGLRVNEHKSYVTGRFRESCGKEYYSGHDVSVVKVRRVAQLGDTVDLPSSRKLVREIESTVALRNRFYLSGLWQTAAWLDRLIEPLLGGYYPPIEVTAKVPWEEPSPRSRVLGRWSVMHVKYPMGMTHVDADYQTLMIKGWVVSSKIPDSPISSEGALIKVLNPRRREPFEDPRHLERAGRPKSFRIKLRKTHF